MSRVANRLKSSIDESMCFGFQLASLVFLGMICIYYLRLERFPSGAKQPFRTQIFAVLYRHEMREF